MGRRGCFHCGSQLSCHCFGHQTANQISCNDSNDATIWFAQSGESADRDDVHSVVGDLSSGQLFSPEEEMGVRRRRPKVAGEEILIKFERAHWRDVRHSFARQICLLDGFLKMSRVALVPPGK